MISEFASPPDNPRGLMRISMELHTFCVFHSIKPACDFRIASPPDNHRGPMRISNNRYQTSSAGL